MALHCPELTSQIVTSFHQLGYAVLPIILPVAGYHVYRVYDIEGHHHGHLNEKFNHNVI